jgi:hypothetical protein
MDPKKLAAAVRDTKEKIDLMSDGLLELDSQDCDELRDAKDLLGVLAHILDGKTVAQAFGSPGDWGYGTLIGRALAAQNNASIFSNVKNPPRPEGDNPVA